ncbi:MAG: glycoside hydrolase family 43 protein [Bacteroidales bacterium]
MSDEKNLKPISEPLITSIYTADPSAHVFEGKIYIYPSHDIDAGLPEDDFGGHFGMEDYHVLSMDSPSDGKVTDHGVALHVKDVPWAERQMWAPDAAYKNGTYYFYFPAKCKDGAFRIGVATSKNPAGPFIAQPEAIKDSFSIDPCTFIDDDGKAYMYFGGIWGGQLQRWQTGKFIENVKTQRDHEPTGDQPALCAKVARMTNDMLEFDEKPRDVVILDENGKPLQAGDYDRRFFEAAWTFKRNGKYYFTYSTGDTHYIRYAIGDNPYGPFKHMGVILNPVIGWTSHHSVVEFKGKWYLYYHDSTLSGGQTHLRCVKVTEISFRPDGTIETVNAYK